MSFKLKLGLAFGSILILMVIVSITSIYGMRRALFHQKELYVVTHALEKKFQTIAKEQNDYLHTSDSVNTRNFFALIQTIRKNLVLLMSAASKPDQKSQFEKLLTALDQYEQQFSRHVQTNVDLETMKSRLQHESRRLMANADAIEKVGDKAVGFLKIMNETLLAEKRYLFDHVRSSVSQVFHNTNRMINMADQIQEQGGSSEIQLYAFRIGKIAGAYQAAFKTCASLTEQKSESAQKITQAFKHLENQLDVYIDQSTAVEKRYISFLQQAVLTIALVAIVLGLFATVLLARRITHPINDLNRSAQQILEGDYTSRVTVTSKDEIARLGISFNEMAKKLEESFKRLKTYQVGLEDLVHERTLEIEAEIRRHQETQKALEKEKDLALTYFDMAGSILIVLDTDGCVAMINKAGRRVLGYESEEIIKKNWFDTCIPEKDRETVQQTIEKIIQGQLTHFEFFENEIVTRQGENRTVSWHNTALKDDSNRVFAVLSAGEDTTDVTRMEKEREHLQAQLIQARKMEAIGTLAGGIAHDFNNILYPIIGYTEMAIAELPSGHPVRKKLKNVFKGALRAKELVRQILTFSRKKSMDIKPIAIQPIVKEALKLLRSTIPQNIAIEHAIDHSASAVMADPTQIYEIIMNLCTNAYHAMEKTGGTLTVQLQAKNQTDAAELPPDLQPGSYCVIIVSDTGPGIPAEIIDQIFEPYFTTKETGKGSGLGLAVTHGIVKAYNGAIKVDSRLGDGTTFNVYLPSLQDDVFLGAPESRLEKKQGRERILFVDDEKEIVTLGVHALSTLGYTVDGRADSAEALEAFKQNPDQYDVLVTDMTMPGLLGTDLVRKIHQIRPDLPAILCTGYSDLVNEDTAKSLGITQYLKKPVMMNELSCAIRDIMDNH